MAKQRTEVEVVDAVEMDACEFLRDIAHGDCVFDLAKGIEKVVKGVRDTSKKGKVELKILLEPFKGDPCRIVVAYECKVSPPPTPRPVSMFFSTMNNTLQRRDPNQVEFGSEHGFPE